MMVQSRERSPMIDRVVRWLEDHPRSVFSSTIVVTLLAALVLSVPPEPVPVEVRVDDPDAPLFI